ncbi:MAG: phosphoribosylanthranilate isomerase [Trueperaceae bacterium]|nr:phosphoribosylanthranilate isomerase [Trueperaceae bacterium]
MKVKICGVTRLEDALFAEQAGVDALGFIFVPHSKRRVSAEQVAEICDALGPFISRVGVFQNATLEHIREVAEEAKLDTIQLHGDEDEVFAKALGRSFKIIKAISFSAKLELKALKAFPADAILLDGIKPGSGETFDWSEAAFLQALPHLILAGGLNPANVEAGIASLKPYAVDAASGVEISPGIKDPDKVLDFIHKAKASEI